MPRIKCKNCGKAYRYETEGCCPECGAYNRPPRREQVNVDGTIYHMTDNDYIDKPHKQAKAHSEKVCFEEKECHEKKVCYEDKIHNKKGPFVVAPLLNQNEKQRNAKKSNNPTSTFIVVACLLIVLAIFSNLMRSCSGSWYDVDYDEPQLVQFTVEDDIATAYLENASDVESGMLCYYDQDNEYCTVDMTSIDIFDEQCKMVFHLDEDFQYAESVDVTFGDSWRSLWVDAGPEDSEPSDDEPYIAEYTVQDDVATVILENAAEVRDAVLYYYDQDNQYRDAEPDTYVFTDDRCIMTFYVGDDYQYAESVDMSYGDDNWISLWTGDMEME